MARVGFDPSLPNHINQIPYAELGCGKPSAPVVRMGMLRKQPDGRYGVGESYFTTGSTIEYLLQEPGDDDRWVCSRIEHHGQDYCIRGNLSLPLGGLRVRIKSVPLWD